MSILVDTSVWIDHLRHGNAELRNWLLADAVLSHAFVIGELACGALRNRGEVISSLRALHRVATVDEAAVLDFIEDHELFGIGVGYVDAHLLASAYDAGVRIWTMDKPLYRAAAKLRIAYTD